METNIDLLQPELLADLREGRGRKSVILPHVRPDGDAMGSTLGLAFALTELGHQCTVLSTTTVSPNYDWIPGQHFLKVAPKLGDEKVEAHLAEADYLWCLDFGDLSRLERLGLAVANAPGKRFCIDHHPGNTGFADVNLVRVAAAATCELVWELAQALAPGYAYPTEMATALYTGLVTDTGSFRHGPTTANVHRVAADLVALGADPLYITHQLFNTQSHSRLVFLGHLLCNRLHRLAHLPVSLITIPIADTQQYAIGEGDLEGVVNYGLSIKDTLLSVLICEEADSIKLSFRSIGSFPANQVAAHFGGGGHVNAAGARSTDGLAETRQKILNLLETTFADSLQYNPFQHQF